MRNNCPKCTSENVRIRTINVGSYKADGAQIECTPLIGLTCFSCGWCGHVPFSKVDLKVVGFDFDENATIDAHHIWESISRLGRFTVGK